MKIKLLAALCGLAAALLFSAGNVSAQDNPPPGGGGPGGGGPGMGRGGRGGYDPAQMQQRILEGVRDQLGFTNDTDWSAVEPLAQKVLQAQMEARGAGLGRLMRGNRGGQGGNRGNRGPFGGEPNPDADNLQKALDDNSPTAQVKTLLAKYQASQKAKQAKLKEAQEALRQVLNSRQEAQATLLGLLD